MARWGWLQKGGLTRGQRPLKSNARKAWDEIRRACDVTDVLYLAGSNLGVGRHKIDLAVDMQAGRGNNGPHQKVADYVLANWNRLGVRYLAWNAHEYQQTVRGGAVPKPRRQTWRSWWNTSSDPEHRNHVHIDWWDNAPNGANPGIAIGAAFDDFKQGSSTTTTPAGPSKAVTQLLADLDYPDVRTAQADLGLVTDGVPGPITITHLEDTVSKLDEILDRVTKTNHAVGRIEPIARALAAAPETGDIDPADIAHIRRRVEQNNAALGRMDPGKKGERA